MHRLLLPLVWLLVTGAADRAVPGNPLIDVAGGTFAFGSDDGAANETPARRLDLPAFRINKFEITNAQYDAMAAATGAPPAFYRNHPVLGAPDHPVVGVSYADAEAFCAHYGLRLPSEAEWERAARGHDGRPYPWGAEPPTAARVNRGAAVCCAGDAEGGWPMTAPVGAHPAGASPEGVHDLIGNVWEWVDAWYNPYGTPPDAEDRQFRVLRGGAWNSDDMRLRATYRLAYRPDFAVAANGGFRCAAAAPPS